MKTKIRNRRASLTGCRICKLLADSDKVGVGIRLHIRLTKLILSRQVPMLLTVVLLSETSILKVRTSRLLSSPVRLTSSISWKIVILIFPARHRALQAVNQYLKSNDMIDLNMWKSSTVWHSSRGCKVNSSNDGIHLVVSTDTEYWWHHQTIPITFDSIGQIVLWNPYSVAHPSGHSVL